MIHIKQRDLKEQNFISTCQIFGLKTIVFDLDNTLIDRNAAFKALMARFFIDEMHYPGLEIPKEEWRRIEEKDDWGYTGRKTFANWFVNTYNPNGYDANGFYDWQILNISNHVEASKGVRQILGQLAQYFRLVLLTNGSLMNQTAKLEKAGLSPYFPSTHRFISQEIGWEKPDKQVFDLILNEFDLLPKKVLMVGDDPINDIQGAKKAGWRTCWISKGRIFPKSLPGPDFNLNNISVKLDKMIGA